MTILKGCDVSDYQHPALVAWSMLDFGVVKATDGTRPAKKTLEHVRAIKAAEKTWGLYHFLRNESSADAQFDAFVKVAEACELGHGCMLPNLDIEDHPGFKLEDAPKEHARKAELFAERAWSKFGGCTLYISKRDFERLGSPSWMLECPLWVAHYPKDGAKSPLLKAATPAGRPWRIWQNLVGPLGLTLQAPKNPRAVDQNIATSPLPLIEHFTAPVSIPWVFDTHL